MKKTRESVLQTKAPTISSSMRHLKARGAEELTTAASSKLYYHIVSFIHTNRHERQKAGSSRQEERERERADLCASSQKTETSNRLLAWHAKCSLRNQAAFDHLRSRNKGTTIKECHLSHSQFFFRGRRRFSIGVWCC